MKITVENLPRLSEPLRIGCFASHNGTDMQAIVAAINSGELAATVELVISNNSKANALTFAQEHGISSFHISSKRKGSHEAATAKMLEELQKAQVNLIILSGYMKPIPPEVIEAYRGRILNVHPALDMERFSGRGMYGDHVHQAVLDEHETVTGVTIHQVDEVYDHGAIVAQSEIAIAHGDTVETLRRRVQEREKALFIEVLHAIPERRAAAAI